MGFQAEKTRGAVVCEVLMCSGAGMGRMPGCMSFVHDEVSNGAE